MPGRPFLQVPGPTNVPDRIVRAMAQPVIDHRGAAFAELTREILTGLKQLFDTSEGTIVLYPGSGTAGWEAALVNTLSPGDQILVVVNGQFSTLWAECARAVGLRTEEIALPWGAAADPERIRERLSADRGGMIKAVLLVHNETSTGVTSDVAAVRAAIDAAGHPALLLLDTVSSLAAMLVRFDEWRVDVAVSGAQKGLMLPPGTAVLCVSPRALAAGARGGSPRYFLDWRPIIEQNRSGFFPYTPATQLLVGMREALRMLFEEGLPHVLARHARLAEGVRRAVRAWELPLLCADPRAYSNSLTAVMMPEGTDSGRLIDWAAERLNLALGAGLGPLRGRLFRIGHLGWLNEVEVLGILGGVEIALREIGVEVRTGAGPAAASSWLAESGVRGAAPAAGSSGVG
jgi:alanine-glyoxylate transaminase/serine-glyoxylate transaminase/serine-pyruvate transaminase